MVALVVTGPAISGTGIKVQANAYLFTDQVFDLDHAMRIVTLLAADAARKRCRAVDLPPVKPADGMVSRSLGGPERSESEPLPTAAAITC